MNKRWLLTFTLGGGVILASYGQGFTDAGFESYRKKQKNPYWWQIVDARNGTALSDFKVKHSGVRSLCVNVAGDSARIRHLSTFLTEPGIRWKISIWAKGTGDFQFVIPQGGVFPHNAKITKLKEVFSPQFKLSDEWKKYLYLYTGTDRTLHNFNVHIQINGKGSCAWFDDAHYEQDSVPGTELRAHPLNCAAKPGEKIRHKVIASGNVKDIVVDLQGLPGVKKVSALPPDKYITFTAPQKPGVYIGAIRDTENGQGQKFFINVLSTKEYSALEKAAAGVKNPGQVLVLGDSLTDYLRGRNWVDLCENFIAGKYGEKVRFFNYAIGGDMVPRTLARFRKVGKTYAFSRYKGIWECKPDVVMIFLGQNDSLLLNRQLGAKSPTRVPPAEFIAGYTDLIKEIRKTYGHPRIILITPVYMDYAKTWKLVFHDKNLVYGEPSIMETYRQLVYQIAKENQCEIIDVFERIKKQDKPANFSLPDGVHINLKGNWLVGEAVLKHFSGADHGN